MSPAATLLSFVAPKPLRRIARWPPASRRHAVLRRTSHISADYPIHHFRRREPSLRRPMRRSVRARLPSYTANAMVSPAACWHLVLSPAPAITAEQIRHVRDLLIRPNRTSPPSPTSSASTAPPSTSTSPRSPLGAHRGGIGQVTGLAGRPHGPGCSPGCTSPVS
jgi:hypothetical protein